jgi:uncharacterized membrane protein
MIFSVLALRRFQTSKDSAVMHETVVGPGAALSMACAVSDLLLATTAAATAAAAASAAAARADEVLGELGIKSVQDLADWKYAAWADALVTLSEYENADFSS